MSHFTPLDEEEHRLGNLGYNVADNCAHCGQPFMEHTNSRCPTWAKREIQAAEKWDALAEKRKG